MNSSIYCNVLAAAAVMLAGGCAKSPAPAGATPQVHAAPAAVLSSSAPGVVPTPNPGVTVFGAVKEADWYMVVTSPNKVKPLIIWSESRTECDVYVADFNLQSVVPDAKGEAPKAWCMLGKDLRSRFDIS